MQLDDTFRPTESIGVTYQPGDNVLLAKTHHAMNPQLKEQKGRIGFVKRMEQVSPNFEALYWIQFPGCDRLYKVRDRYLQPAPIEKPWQQGDICYIPRSLSQARASDRGDEPPTPSCC